MSEVIGKKKSPSNKTLANLVGTTDPNIDYQARERLITSRIGLLLRNPFFGNIATRLKLVNADEWCNTAATDGLNLYYNSRFIMMLKPKEVEFLVGHEVLHVVYDHIGRRGTRDLQTFNIANDYAVNADLKRHRIGEFITTVPCLYDVRYDKKSSEEIYDDLMKNAHKMSLSDLLDQLLDDHLDDDDAEDDDENDGEGGNRGSKRPKMTSEDRERARQELKQAIIHAAQSAEAGQIPSGVERLIKQFTDPVLPWRELIQTNLTSAIRTDFSWMRPNRRGWHMDAVMPGMTPGEEIDVTIALDMSGSISTAQAQSFLGEIGGMMNSFDGYRIRVLSFDTDVYNEQVFSSENMASIEEYVPCGGGGTDFECVFAYLKDKGDVPNRLIMFTDGYPAGSWGDEFFCDTTFIIHGSDSIVPPFGQWAYLKD